MKKFLTLVLLSTSAITAGAQTLTDAIKLTDKEQFEKATSAFKKIVVAEPQNGEAWFYFGENYWENGRTDSAEVCYRQGNGVGGKFPLNKVGLGKALWSQGKKDEAQQMFIQAVSDATDKANKLPKPLQAATYREVAEAVSQGQGKDLIKAQEYIAKAIELDPKNPETYVLKGDVLFDLNPRDGSSPLENYKTAINLDALNAKPVTRKAFMYYRAKNNPAAIEEYTNAITIDGSFAPAYSGRAEAYIKVSDFTKAEADMAKYLELNTGNQSARVRQAQFLFLVGKYKESLDLINTLEREGVKNIVLKRLQGYDLVEMKDSVNAKPTLDAYLAEQPEDKRIAADYEYYGKSLQLLRQDSAAGENMLKGARMDKTKDYLFTDAAKAFAKAKAYDKAIGAMREKIANSSKPETNDYYYLGDVALKGKRWATADSAWATYTERNPNAYQGFKFRARAQAGTDTLAIERRTWAAKPYYEQVLVKMKPEEKDKYKADLEETLNYMGLYFLYNKEARDLPKAKCYFEKIKLLNVGTSITKQVTEQMLLVKELKDVAPGICD
ncbi:MAG: hypothetical protein KA791_04140 [Flavobacteriales bacterium]|nr:hypothetical protein [Flavobacteriales bacterium]